MLIFPTPWLRALPTFGRARAMNWIQDFAVRWIYCPLSGSWVMQKMGHLSKPYCLGCPPRLDLFNYLLFNIFEPLLHGLSDHLICVMEHRCGEVGVIKTPTSEEESGSRSGHRAKAVQYGDTPWKVGHPTAHMSNRWNISNIVPMERYWPAKEKMVVSNCCAKTKPSNLHGRTSGQVNMGYEPMGHKPQLLSKLLPSVCVLNSFNRAT